MFISSKFPTTMLEDYQNLKRGDGDGFYVLKCGKLLQSESFLSLTI